jgi:hypothetical protein
MHPLFAARAAACLLPVEEPSSGMAHFYYSKGSETRFFPEPSQ